MTTIKVLKHKEYDDNWNQFRLDLPFNPELLIVYSNPQRIGDIVVNSGMFLALRARFPQADIYQLERDAYPTSALWAAHPAKIKRLLFPDICFNPRKNKVWQPSAKNQQDDFLELKLDCTKALLIDTVRKLVCSLLVSYKVRAGYRYSMLPRYPFLSGFSCSQQGFKRNLGKCNIWFLSQMVVYPITQTLLPPKVSWLTTKFVELVKDWIIANIKNQQEFIVICPTAGHITRYWCYQQWRQVIKHITALGMIPVVIVPASERQQIEPEFASTPEVVFFPGDNPELNDPAASLELMRSARLTVGVDSGGVHLAAAAGCPVVVLTFPSSYIRWLPITTRGRAVVSDVQELSPTTPTWFTGIQAEQVCEAIDQILAEC